MFVYFHCKNNVIEYWTWNFLLLKFMCVCVCGFVYIFLTLNEYDIALIYHLIM